MKVESEINESTIKQQVDCFYGKVRQDRDLAPIFEAAIGTSAVQWAPHLEKMYAFWSSIFLGSQRYAGNPLQKHRLLPPFPEGLFDRWLSLFAATADELFVPALADTWKEKSQRIATSLRLGIYGFDGLPRKA